MSAPVRAVPSQKLPVAESMLRGRDFSGVSSLAVPTGAHFDPLLTDSFLVAALKKHPLADDEGSSKNVSALDAYLAPRVHSLLRLPRNVAALPGLWCWCASSPFLAYMDARWPLSESPSTWRYSSRDPLRNGVARLWWGAEMLRSGGDYTLVPDAFKSVRRFQFVSELRYSMHRECARAFVRALDEMDADDEDAQELSKRFNVYLKARALESWDYADPDAESTFDEKWAIRDLSLAELTADVAELSGPKTGTSRSDIEEELLTWLLRIGREGA